MAACFFADAGVNVNVRFYDLHLKRLRCSRGAFAPRGIILVFSFEFLVLSFELRNPDVLGWVFYLIFIVILFFGVEFRLIETRKEGMR